MRSSMIDTLDSPVTSSEPLQPTAAGSAGPVALAALGTNAWAMSVGWTLLSADVSMTHALLASGGLAVLWASSLLHARSRSESMRLAACWLLLCVFPLSLALALCLGDEVARERTHSALSLPRSALALLAYGAAAVQSCRAPLPLLPVTSHARKAERPQAPEAGRTLRLVASGILLAGSGAIALIAPLMSGYPQLKAAWGDAAGAGSVLAAVVGGALAVSIVGLELGALYRSKQGASVLTRRQRTNRMATWLFAALVGAVLYGILQP
jgi:hypothetical protein